MPGEVHSLTLLTRVLAEQVELAEPVGFDEISALGPAGSGWRSCLVEKCRRLLEDDALCPALSLHRRRLVAAVEIDHADMVFEPPKRSPDWLEPVHVQIPFARWEEGDLHHAFVPGLGVRVFATRPELIGPRVERHVRLVLASRGRHLSLRRLVLLARVASLRLERAELTVSRKTPREIAVASQASVEKGSALASMAEEWVFATEGPGSGATGAQQAFGMEDEVGQLAGLLTGPHRRSVLLVGGSGCGKTALVRELARRGRDLGFVGTSFWSTSGARMMTGSSGFGMWQERCQQMCRELAKANALIHLGRLAELVEVGRVSRNQASVGDFLRPWIARGDVLAVAECTPKELGDLARREPQLVAAFLQMVVPERTPDQARTILEQVFSSSPGKAPQDAAATHSALDRLQRLHQRYATYSANPGRPLRFLKNLLVDVFPEKTLSEAQVLAAFSRETGLPAVLLDDAVPLDLAQARDWFEGRVMGQREAAGQVVDLLAVIKARLARPRKPLASLLFMGPTGTGKTEMAKALAEFLFGDVARLVRFDLNEFSDPVSVQRLIGGPAVGDAEGLMTARVREQPFSVILLDEFEKADTAFFDLLLQVLGEGRLTDAAGRVADFCNSVIVMTSNLGAEEFQRGTAGFRPGAHSGADARGHFTAAARKFLRPEIFNRLDGILPFQPLNHATVLQIARRHLDWVRLRDGLRLRSIEWHMAPEVAEHLAQRGYDVRYGARPLKRTIERELLVPLAEALNRYGPDTPLAVTVGVQRARLVVEIKARNGGAGGQAARPDRRGVAERAPVAPRWSPGGAAGDLVRAIVAARRTLNRLQRGNAVSRLENDMTALTAIERRMELGGGKSPEAHKRLAALPRLRETLMRIADLVARSRQVESEVLVAVYRREPVDAAVFGPELEKIEGSRASVVRSVFRLLEESPDDIVLGCFSEDRATLFAVASAYHKLGLRLGRVMALDCFRPSARGRAASVPLERVTPTNPEAFLLARPDKTVGIVMHLQGDLFRERFGKEAGLHVLKGKQSERVCLVESAVCPFTGFAPPPGVDRPGGIKARGAPLCRTFDEARECVRDSVLGERPWNGDGLTRCMEALTEDRLAKAIERATT